MSFEGFTFRLSILVPKYSFNRQRPQPILQNSSIAEKVMLFSEYFYWSKLLKGIKTKNQSFIVIRSPFFICDYFLS